ncbi:hypothetical protein F5X68DRAFT_144521 [Plectosphaerella plurivora]|uniref:Uncharacterized protein n=1 Tax=Plectosphaerella plurivora TaxID=936078 RepID=A0A9P9A588_9PEZI|nr:hypothetical protein F5X68DRAFT_144521 [Plectosphaerella plurivora]
MAPLPNDAESSGPAEAFRRQWSQPADVFSVLLLLGGEVVHRALGQLAGGKMATVTFSFGWASYAIMMLLASIGDAKLMPVVPSDSCLVVNVKSGYVRSNVSCVIDRLVRDYDSWMDEAIKERLNQMLDDRMRYMQQKVRKGTNIPRPGQTGLCVGVYEPSQVLGCGEPVRDLIFWSGPLVSLVQLALALIPLVTDGDWFVLLITLCGTFLALATGSLPAWAAEKWACRRGTYSSFVLTKGNGFQHAILILGNGRGLNLEDLAVASRLYQGPSDIMTRASLAVLATLWVLLLVSAAGVANGAIYLLAIGGLGMFHCIVVVGSRRKPGALGVHLEYRGVVGDMTVMGSLLQCEERYSGVGKALLPIFFPGKLLPEEVAQWAALEESKRIAKEAEQDSGTAGEESRVVESWTAHARSHQVTP